jgi:predicted RNA-binding Zn ribbon-like protein
MSDSALLSDVDPALPFKYVAGDPSLDLVNTVDWTDAGLVDERLATYDGLTRWAQGAGLVPAETGAALRGAAAERPDEARRVVERALALRALLRRVFTGLAAGRIAERDLAELDAAFADALGRLHLAADAGAPTRVTWAWRGWGEALDSPLWPVVWSAARLLASDERTQVRECAGERCGWMYVDRSRNGLRRWCQTDVCGARAKARRYYARKRAEPRSEEGGEAR